MPVLYREGSGLTFFFDEWNFLTTRSWSVSDLLTPHNGHLSAIPVAIYVTIRSTFGVDSYVPFQIVGLLTHCCVGLAVYTISRRWSLPVALLTLPLVLLLGSGWQNIMWPFQIGMMACLGFGLMSIDEASRDVPRVRVCAWLSLSLMCAGGGVAAAGSVIALLTYRRAWRVLRGVSLVMLAYVSWYVTYGDSQSVDGNGRLLVGYVRDSAVGAAQGVTGRGRESAFLLLAMLGVGLCATAKRSFHSRETTFLLGVAIFLAATWLLTGWSRAHLQEPAASRYVYVGSICLIAMSAVVIGSSLPRVGFVVPLLGLLLFISPNSAMLRAGAGGLRDTSYHVRALLGAIDMTRIRPATDQVVESSRAPQLTVSAYDTLSRKYGKIGFSAVEMVSLPDSYRVSADRMLFALGTTEVRMDAPDECKEATVVLNREVFLPTGAVVFVKPDTRMSMSFRRFATESAGTVMELPVGQWTSIRNRAESSVPQLKLGLENGRAYGCITTTAD